MRVLKRLFLLLRPYWKALTVSVLLLIVGAGVALMPPLFQRAIVDQVIVSVDPTRLGILIGGLVAVYALQQLINAGDLFIRHALGERFIFDLRVRLYAYLQQLSLSFFERTSTGELMSRVTNELRLVGGAVILFVLDARLALLVLLPVPVLAISLRLFNTRIRPVYRRVRARLGDINAELQDSLSGIQVIQSFVQEEQALARFRNESENYYRARVQGIRYWATFFPAMRFVAAMGTVIVLAAGSVMAVQGSLTLGTLVAFLSYTASFYEPINRLTEIDNVFQEAIAAGERIFELFDEPSEVQDAPDAAPLPTIAGEVEFDNVRFRYGTGEEVLHDVSFRMAPGEVVALVGPSGAGKTSIANLLCRFYDPIEGRVMVDGHDLRAGYLPLQYDGSGQPVDGETRCQ